MGAGSTDRPPLKSTARYLAGWLLPLALLYWLLIAPWTGLGDAYASLYRAGMTQMGKVLSPYNRVEAVRYDDQLPLHDSRIIVPPWVP